MKICAFLILIPAVFSLSQREAKATPPVDSDHAPQSVPSGNPVLRRKHQVSHEKEAEGTQAPNRFDQDTIIKSRYELDGQNLEVDTD